MRRVGVLVDGHSRILRYMSAAICDYARLRGYYVGASVNPRNSLGFFGPGERWMLPARPGTWFTTCQVLVWPVDLWHCIKRGVDTETRHIVMCDTDGLLAGKPHALLRLSPGAHTTAYLVPPLSLSFAASGYKQPLLWLDASDIRAANACFLAATAMPDAIIAVGPGVPRSEVPRFMPPGSASRLVYIQCREELLRLALACGAVCVFTTGVDWRAVDLMGLGIPTLTTGRLPRSMLAFEFPAVLTSQGVADTMVGWLNDLTKPGVWAQRADAAYYAAEQARTQFRDAMGRLLEL